MGWLVSKSKALGIAVDTAFCDGACACLVSWGQQAKNSVAVCERFCSRSKNTCKSVYGEDISFLMYMVFLEMEFRFLLGRNKIARLLLHYILSLPLFYFPRVKFFNHDIRKNHSCSLQDRLGVLVSGYDRFSRYHSGLNLRETIIYNKLIFYEYISLDIDDLLELCLARKIDG